MGRFALCLVPCFLVLPLWASNFDEPLGDCSDWVITNSEVTCTEVIPWPCEDAGGIPRGICDHGNGTAAGNDGDIYTWRRRIPIPPAPQTSCGDQLFRVELLAFREGADDDVIAYIDERCDSGSAGTVRRRVSPNGVTFDEEHGQLYLSLVSGCEGASFFRCDRARLLRFGSFATSFGGLPHCRTTPSRRCRERPRPEVLLEVLQLDTPFVEAMAEQGSGQCSFSGGACTVNADCPVAESCTNTTGCQLTARQWQATLRNVVRDTEPSLLDEIALHRVDITYDWQVPGPPNDTLSVGLGGAVIPPNGIASVTFFPIPASRLGDPGVQGNSADLVLVFEGTTGRGSPISVAVQAQLNVQDCP